MNRRNEAAIARLAKALPLDEEGHLDETVVRTADVEAALVDIKASANPDATAGQWIADHLGGAA